MNGPDPTNPHPMNGFPQVCFVSGDMPALQACAELP